MVLRSAHNSGESNLETQMIDDSGNPESLHTSLQSQVSSTYGDETDQKARENKQDLDSQSQVIQNISICKCFPTPIHAHGKISDSTPELYESSINQSSNSVTSGHVHGHGRPESNFSSFSTQYSGTDSFLPGYPHQSNLSAQDTNVSKGRTGNHLQDQENIRPVSNQQHYGYDQYTGRSVHMTQNHQHLGQHNQVLRTETNYQAHGHANSHAQPHVVICPNKATHAQLAHHHHHQMINNQINAAHAHHIHTELNGHGHNNHMQNLNQVTHGHNNHGHHGQGQLPQPHIVPVYNQGTTNVRTAPLGNTFGGFRSNSQIPNLSNTNSTFNKNYAHCQHLTKKDSNTNGGSNNNNSTCIVNQQPTSIANSVPSKPSSRWGFGPENIRSRLSLNQRSVGSSNLLSSISNKTSGNSHNSTTNKEALAKNSKINFTENYSRPSIRAQSLHYYNENNNIRFAKMENMIVSKQQDASNKNEDSIKQLTVLPCSDSRNSPGHYGFEILTIVLDALKNEQNPKSTTQPYHCEAISQESIESQIGYGIYLESTETNIIKKRYWEGINFLRTSTFEKNREKVILYGIYLQNRLDHYSETFHISVAIFDRYYQAVFRSEDDSLRW